MGKYAESILNKDEKVALTAKRNFLGVLKECIPVAISLLFSCVFSALYLVLVATVFGGIGGLFEAIGNGEVVIKDLINARYLLILLVAVFSLAMSLITGVFKLGRAIFKFAYVELSLTNRRLIGRTIAKKGFFNTCTMDAPIDKIQTCMVEQNLLGKIFNFATVTVKTAAGSYFFPYIKDAEQFKNRLTAQMDELETERAKKQAEEMAHAIAASRQKAAAAPVAETPASESPVAEEVDVKAEAAPAEETAETTEN